MGAWISGAGVSLQLSLFSPKWTAPAPTPQPPARVPYRDPFLAYCAEYMRTTGPGPLRFDADTWGEETGGAVGMDVEVYRNFFTVCFRRFRDGKRLAFEKSERSELDKDGIQRVLSGNTIVTFNGNSYDMPVLHLALAGRDCTSLKIASDRIVLGSVRPWDAERELGVRVPRLNHIDLIEPNPAVRQGLKIIAGRLHARFLVDLPFPPDAVLTHEQMDVTTLYCHNDLEYTESLYVALREPLELRVSMSRQYGGTDFRSKSDSQVGEAIVRRRVEAATGARIQKTVPRSTTFGYAVPQFVAFTTPTLRAVLEEIRTSTFAASAGGKIAAPPFLETLQVRVGAMTYSLGIGGLHSTEAHRALYSDDERFLLDVDVASQYPNIIVGLGLSPPALGPAFLKIYGELIRDRLAAKDKMLEIERRLRGSNLPEAEKETLRREMTSHKARADGGRIALNGVFGKLGSAYSCLYAPEMLIATTLTGQLAVLMLIERSETAGIPVVSANTDGVVFHCPRALADRLQEILQTWETATGFSIEQTPYRMLCNSSVNTYIAVREDGKVKRKGIVADPWSEGDLRGQMSKNPAMTVCSEAIVRWLTDRVPLQETVTACRDPRKFVTVVKVAGGALWRGHPLGRAIRYYWSCDGSPVMYADGSKRVSKTEGAYPMQELTADLPPDLDIVRYCEEAARLAADLGIVDVA